MATCKVCGAPLRTDEIRCPYCGTAVRVGEVKYAKIVERKHRIVTAIVAKHFPGRYVTDLGNSYEGEHSWIITCSGASERALGRRVWILWRKCFEVNGRLTDTTWGDMTIQSYHPNYNAGAEAVAHELKLYTNVNLSLAR